MYGLNQFLCQRQTYARTLLPVVGSAIGLIKTVE